MDDKRTQIPALNRKPDILLTSFQATVRKETVEQTDK